MQLQEQKGYNMLIFTEKNQSLSSTEKAITAMCVCSSLHSFYSILLVAVVHRSIQCLSYGPDIAERTKLIPVCNPSSEIEVQSAADRSQRQ